MVGALAVCLVATMYPASARGSSLRISAASNVRLAGSEVEADYTTSHLFVNEVAGDSVPVTVFYDPQVTGVASAEVFTNLNRRAMAASSAHNNGIEEGIVPPPGNSIAAGDDTHYYKAYPMQLVPGGYQLTLQATKCGAYRLSARYRLQSDPPGAYHWYGDESRGPNLVKRDHAIVVSPAKARNAQLYEANPLTMLATGTLPAQRGTLADMAKGLPAGHGPAFSLAYMKELGCNMLWLQPIHPRGIEGRQTDPTTKAPYALGSPYAVKNFFAVMPLLAKSFTPTGTPATDDTEAGRALGLAEFRQFVEAADQANVDIMLDAPFNHTAHDAELAARGVKYWNNGSPETAEIRNTEARFYSRTNAYDMRASMAGNVAIAPDRYDFSSGPGFGKWTDVFDIYFGRYAALVPNDAGINDYKDEDDWFDYSIGDENQEGKGNGHFDVITQNIWRYFGDYTQYWLTQTGYPANAEGASLDSTAGIDGLRADFAQGLPPQCWEYIINRTRTRKWNFVFMAESLDGGPVTYRSARHFDVLNENMIYELHHAQTAGAFRTAYESRRSAYGPALVLLNTSSQDEDNYKNPFEALLRFAANSTIDGLPMIFPGQELGLSGTIIPPNDSDASKGPPFGYDRYELGFADKPIPQFKAYNSLMPLWNHLAKKEGDADHLHDLYAAIGQARVSSPALRSTNRSFLDLVNNAPHDAIYAVAKFEQSNGDPATTDVVFAFVNLTVGADAETPAGAGFNVNLPGGPAGANLFGIKPDHIYNAKNIAAYTGKDPNRRSVFLWRDGRKGSDLLAKGIEVKLPQVPGTDSAWSSAPYEAQYLKLFDVTPAGGGTAQ